MEQKQHTDEMEINLIDLFLVLWRGKWLIIGLTILAMVVAIGLGLREEHTYEVSASFAVTGDTYRIGLGDETRMDISILLGILNSSRLALIVTEELNLHEYWEDPTMVRASERLKDRINIRTNQEKTIITISFQSTDPQLAKDVVDSYINNFEDLNREINLTEAGQALAFVESRLEEVEADLAQAIDELQAFQSRYRIFSLDDQSKALVDTYVKLEDNLRNFRREYNVMLESKSTNHPDVRRLERQMEEIETQLNALEKGMVEEMEELDVVGTIFGLEEIPRITLELSRLRDEVDMQRESYKLLRSQEETLKIEASKEADMVRPIDAPSFPERPMGRGLALKGAIAGVLGGMVSVFLVFVWNFIRTTEWEEDVLKEFPLLRKFARQEENSDT